VSWEPGPGRPSLPEGELHVWRARLDKPGWPGAEGLPDVDRRRAESFLRPGPGRRWVAARWALRLTIAAYVGADPAAIELEAEDGGKPRLTGGDPIRFNLSHSHDLALIALARGREVGIDVERRVPGRDFAALAREGLGPEAPEEIDADSFYEAWVRREAIAKCGGEGLAGPAPAGPIEVQPLEVGAAWAAAVALAGSAPAAIRCFERAPWLREGVV
jgi:4'-phosphopantetheinyl transferase